MALRFPNNLPIDGGRLALTVSDVSPVTEWKDNRPTGNQARDENTGFPLWSIEVKFRDEVGETVGRADVMLGAQMKPELDDGDPIECDNLQVNFWAGKSGLAGRFTASAVRRASTNKPKAAAAAAPAA